MREQYEILFDNDWIPQQSRILFPDSFANLITDLFSKCRSPLTATAQDSQCNPPGHHRFLGHPSLLRFCQCATEPGLCQSHPTCSKKSGVRTYINPPTQQLSDILTGCNTRRGGDPPDRLDRSNQRRAAARPTCRLPCQPFHAAQGLSA